MIIFINYGSIDSNTFPLAVGDPITEPLRPEAESPAIPAGVTAAVILQNSINWASLAGNTITGTRYTLTVTQVTTKVTSGVTVAVFDGTGSGSLVPTREDSCLADFTKCDNGFTFRYRYASFMSMVVVVTVTNTMLQSMIMDLPLCQFLV